MHTRRSHINEDTTTTRTIAKHRPQGYNTIQVDTNTTRMGTMRKNTRHHNHGNRQDGHMRTVNQLITQAIINNHEELTDVDGASLILIRYQDACDIQLPISTEGHDTTDWQQHLDPNYNITDIWVTTTRTVYRIATDDDHTTYHVDTAPRALPIE